MSDTPPSNVPNEGPIELQLLAIQRELSWCKNSYINMNKRIEHLISQMGNVEHLELFAKVSKLLDEYFKDKYE